MKKERKKVKLEKGKITTYLLVVWPKFKLPTYDLKSHDTSIPLDFCWSYFILYFYVFCAFGGERHKSEAKLHI